jgi:hypothetical protein
MFSPMLPSPMMETCGDWTAMLTGFGHEHATSGRRAIHIIGKIEDARTITDNACLEKKQKQPNKLGRNYYFIISSPIVVARAQPYRLNTDCIFQDCFHSG